MIHETLKYSLGLAKIFDKKTPAQLIFFVTNRCNSRCRHCFYWQEMSEKKNELTLEEITKISKSMGRLFWLFISGGEPYLRNDLPQICKTFYKYNHVRSIVIPTNGLLVKKILTSTEGIAKSCPEAKIIIQLSIDQLGEKHDDIRQIPGNFKKVQKVAEGLRKLKRKYKNIALQTNIVFSKYNQDEVMLIYKWIERNLKPDNICLSLIRGNPREIGAGDIDLTNYYNAHEEMKMLKRFKQYNRFLSYLITKKEDMMVEAFRKSLGKKKPAIGCLAGKQTAVLGPDGQLFACELRSESFGNLREVQYDFKRLWEGKTAENVRENLKGCYCTNECIYTPNVFLNFKTWPTFLKYLVIKHL